MTNVVDITKGAREIELPREPWCIFTGTLERTPVSKEKRMVLDKFSKLIARQRKRSLEMSIDRGRTGGFVGGIACVSRWLDLFLGLRVGGRALTICAVPMRNAVWLNWVTMVPFVRLHIVLAWKGTVHHSGGGTLGRTLQCSNLECSHGTLFCLMRSGSSEATFFACSPITSRISLFSDSP
jgi:hypothetical protein